jgi:hypothetical protein
MIVMGKGTGYCALQNLLKSAFDVIIFLSFPTSELLSKIPLARVFNRYLHFDLYGIAISSRVDKRRKQSIEYE